MDNRCETCKYAEWEYCEGAGPGFPRGFNAICGCRREEDESVFDVLAENGYDVDDWESGEIGDTKPCPLWEEYIEPEEPDYAPFLSENMYRDWEPFDENGIPY